MTPRLARATRRHANRLAPSTALLILWATPLLAQSWQEDHYVADVNPRGIHLGLTDDPATSAIVTWYTRSPLAGRPRVTVTRSGEADRWTVAGESQVHSALGSSIYHEVFIDGLEPGTSYEIVPLPGSAPAQSVIATTFSDKADSLVFTVYGDQGVGEMAHRIAQQVAATPADMHLHLGDLSYAAGEASIWDEWMQLIEPVAMDRPYITSLGNHERESPWGSYGAILRLFMPGNEHYFAVRNGPMVLVVLDSNWLSGSRARKQKTWLTDTLRSAQGDESARWLIVALHHPLYSSSKHGSNRLLRTEVEPLLSQYGVDLVLAGHDHVYERTYPVNNGIVQNTEAWEYVDPGSPIHLVSGGGGRHLSDEGWSDFTVVTESQYHFLRVAIHGFERLSVEAIDVHGTVFDRFAITKARS